MYLYFDRNKNLKEIINDKALISGDSGIDKIYAYFEEVDYELLITSATIRYTLPDGSLYPVSAVKVYDNVYDKNTTPIPDKCYIPFNEKRDLKFFKYYTPYTFYEFDIPDDVVGLEEDGTVVANIVFTSGTSNYALQGVPFFVDGFEGHVKPNESITVAQYNNLLRELGKYQRKLTAGTGISINANNVISANLSGGDGINYSNGVISIDDDYVVIKETLSGQTIKAETNATPLTLEGGGDTTFVGFKNGFGDTIGYIGVDGTEAFETIKPCFLKVGETDVDYLATEDYIDDAITSEATTRASADTNLQNQIDNIKSRGRFLSVWNGTTGKPNDLPTDIATTAYTYKTGDYFIVGTSGIKMPTGTSIPAGTTIQTFPSVDGTTTENVNDTILFNGSTWSLIHTEIPTVSFSTITGQPTDNTNLATALNGKQATLQNGEATYISGGNKVNVSYDDETITNGDNGLEVNLANVQAKLPTTTTAGKVLKSTSTAGTVEWGDSSGGSGDVQVIDLHGLCAKYGDTWSSYQFEEETDFPSINVNKPVVFKNGYYKPNWNADEVDYTTTTAQVIAYKDNNGHYKEDIRIYNFRNASITINSITRATGNFSSYVGTTITQNNDTTIWTADLGTTNPFPLAEEDDHILINVSYTLSGTTYTSNVDVKPISVFLEKELNAYFSGVEHKYDEENEWNFYRFRTNFLDTTDTLKVEMEQESLEIRIRIIDNSSKDKTRIDMSRFTFEAKTKSSTSALGQKLATLLIDADKTKPIELYDFRVGDETKDNNNICELSVNGQGVNNIFEGMVMYENVLYRLYIEANKTTSPYLKYYITPVGVDINFGGYTITSSTKTTTSQNVVDRFIGVAETNKRIASSEDINLPFTLWNYKIDSSSNPRNNACLMRCVSKTTSGGVDTYTFKGYDNYNNIEITVSCSSNSANFMYSYKEIGNVNAITGNSVYIRSLDDGVYRLYGTLSQSNMNVYYRGGTSTAYITIKTPAILIVSSYSTNGKSWTILCNTYLGAYDYGGYIWTGHIENKTSSFYGTFDEICLDELTSKYVKLYNIDYDELNSMDFVYCTQVEYNSATKRNNTLYIIVG